MDVKAFILEFEKLSDGHQDQLLQDLKKSRSSKNYAPLLKARGNMLDNKGGECPHCESVHYTKFGSDKGSRRYRCSECCRTFTEYTGTWISGIHNKQAIPGFLKTMDSELSLLKTSKELNLDVGTVFRWRHKFLSAVEIDENSDFKGITESDETFFLESQKGKKCTDRDPRKRGGGNKRGISNEQATVLTTMDRFGNSELKFSNMGRISEQVLETTLGHRIGSRTILCSDGHNSYKAFSSTHDIEHQIIVASKGQHTKGVFHIQHINSLHGRIKQFFNIQRRGVATKYLQKYLNWQKIKDKFKDSDSWIKAVLIFSMQQQNALKIFDQIQYEYDQIYNSTQIAN